MICKKRLLNSYLLYWHFLWMSLWKKKKKSLTLCFPKGGCIFSPLCSLPIFEKPTFPYQIKCPVPNTGHNITHSFPTGWNSSLSKLLPAALQSLNQGTTLPSRKHTGFFFFFFAQSCPTLCDPMGYSLPGSSIHGIFQARVLEWGAISFSRGSSWPRDRSRVSRIAGRRFTVWANREALADIGKGQALVTKLCPTLAAPWFVARQVPLSMRFSRQEYWSGLPFPSAGDLPDPGIEPGYPVLKFHIRYHRGETTTYAAPYTK